MDISCAKFFVWHDMDNDVIYTSKSLDTISEKNDFFPISVWGVIPTQSGDKMISVEMGNSCPVLVSGMYGMFLHWEYFKKAYSQLKMIEI